MAMLKRMIERGNTKDIEEKVDVFYAVGKITRAEYEELVAMLR